MVITCRAPFQRCLCELDCRIPWKDTRKIGCRSIEGRVEPVFRAFHGAPLKFSENQYVEIFFRHKILFLQHETVVRGGEAEAVIFLIAASLFHHLIMKLFPAAMHWNQHRTIPHHSST